jgi:hypothetical protein
MERVVPMASPLQIGQCQIFVHPSNMRPPSLTRLRRNTLILEKVGASSQKQGLLVVHDNFRHRSLPQ